ncbi:MAG: helix-turn-helix transcriptional regulator [Oscillibacter sp.]|nr:helix-turn-helix transcriptional regulator [Oscillibacter sp.]
MDTREAVAYRIRQLCREQGVTPNGISNIAGVPQATVKSILNGESGNPGTVTIKKLCDGFGVTLGQFFSAPEFDALEQEIK